MTLDPEPSHAHTRVKRFLENHRIRDVLVRDQIDKISPSLRGVVLAEWEAATHMLMAAIKVNDVIGTADAVFQVDAVIHRANMAVIAPRLMEAGLQKRARRLAAAKTNETKRRRRDSKAAEVQRRLATGEKPKNIIADTKIPKTSAYRYRSPTR